MKSILRNFIMLVVLSNILTVNAWSVELPADDIQIIMLHEGEYVSVVGKVVSTHKAKSGKVRFLNFGPDYKKAFSVVIFTSDLNKFESRIGEPTEYYLKKKVKVDGRIKIYKNKPEIIVNDPSQINILE